MNKLTVEADRLRLDEVLGFVEDTLSDAGCPPKVLIRLNVCVEEVFVNIASYAYPAGPGPAYITCGVENGAAVMIFEDEGVPYNPLQRADPDVTLSAEARDIGGLGIYMVKKSMDSVEYAYADGRNRLTLVKRL